MEELAGGFRGAFFGGFNRNDVLSYIEKTDAQYYKETEELKQQLSEAQNALAGIKEQNEELTGKNAELLERLGEMTLNTDKIRAQLDEIEKGFKLQSSEIEKQSVRVSELAEKNDRLMEENSRLSVKCGEYDASKDKLAEMELSAYRRARKLEEDAKNELMKLRQQSMDMIERVKRQLDETKENYRMMLARSQQETVEMQKKAGQVLGEIDRISATLVTNDDTKGKKADSVKELLDGIRAKTEGHGGTL